MRSTFKWLIAGSVCGGVTFMVAWTVSSQILIRYDSPWYHQGIPQLVAYGIGAVLAIIGALGSGALLGGPSNGHFFHSVRQVMLLSALLIGIALLLAIGLAAYMLFVVRPTGMSSLAIFAPFMLPIMAVPFSVIFYSTACVFRPADFQEGVIPPLHKRSMLAGLIIASLLGYVGLTIHRLFDNTELTRSEPSIHGHISGVSFAPTGNRLITTEGGQLKVWDIGTRTLVHAISARYPNEHGILVYSTDGRLVAFATDAYNAVDVWDIEHGTRVRTFAISGKSAKAVGFTPDRTGLITFCQEEGLQVWDLESGRLRTAKQLGSLQWIDSSQSKNGKWIALVAHQAFPEPPPKAYVYDTETLNLLPLVVPNDSWRVKFMEDGQRLGIVYKGSEYLFFDIGSWQQPSASLSPNDTKALVLAMETYFDGHLMRALRDHLKSCCTGIPAFSIAVLTPDHTRLVLRRDDGGISVVHLETGKVSALTTPDRLGGRSINELYISTDSRWLVTPYHDKASVWDLDSLTYVGPLMVDDTSKQAG